MSPNQGRLILSLQKGLVVTEAASMGPGPAGERGTHLNPRSVPASGCR